MKKRINVYLDKEQIATFKAEATFARRSLSEWMAIACDQVALQVRVDRVAGYADVAMARHPEDGK